MLTVDDFKTRANSLFESCRDRWRKQLQKAAPNGVVLDIAAEDVLPFTRHRFHQWLWVAIGLQAIPCPYCTAPVDVLSMQLDHKTPLRRGGGPELTNLQPICADCNKAKGEFTDQEFRVLVACMNGPAAFFRDRLMGVLKNGCMGNMMKNFSRKLPKREKKAKRVQRALTFGLTEF